MAFVVGIGNYDGKADLKNPPKDAKLIHEALAFNRFEGPGPLIDPDRRAVRSAFLAFVDAAAEARAEGDEVIAFVYVSGHGLTGESMNDEGKPRPYLIPRGTSVFDGPLDPFLLDEQAIALEFFRYHLIKADVQKIVLVFDACRTRPVPRRGTKAAPPSGLARLPEPPPGAQVLSLYATREGYEAIDLGPGGRNVFAEVLAEALRTRADLNGVLEDVEKIVPKELGNKQIPDIQGRLNFMLDEERNTAAFAKSLPRMVAQNPALAKTLADSGIVLIASNPAADLAGAGDERLSLVRPASQQVPRLAMTTTARLPVGDAGPWTSVRILDASRETEAALKAYGFETLKAQADAGDGYAKYLVGYAFNVGLGTPTDHGSAMKYLKEAYAEGEHRAANVIGFMFRQGDGVEKDEQEALRWFKLAAEKGVGVAAANIGAAHRDGRFGLEKNRDLALAYFRKGAMQGSAYALEMLATELRRGTGGRPDPNQAMQIYHHLLANGYGSGARELAAMYMSGEGVEPDQAIANLYLRRAGELGEVYEAKWFADRAFEGIGLPAPDPELGAYFLQKAADGGNADAMNQLGARLRDGKDGEPRPKEAAAWIQRASNLGSINAKISLAKLYFEGVGVPVATDAGLSYLEEIVEEEQTSAKPEVWPMEYYSAGIELVSRLQKLNRAAAGSFTLADLEKMYGTASGLKRFTVPIDCTPAGAAAAQTMPYQVFVFDWGRATDMVKPQLDWVVRERGCRVSADITDSFAKLYNIALENKVSFTDLTVYAFKEAQKEVAPAGPTSP
jgi:TPR repeat protein